MRVYDFLTPGVDTTRIVFKTRTHSTYPLHNKIHSDKLQLSLEDVSVADVDSAV